MSLNDGTLDLGALKGTRSRQSSLKGLLQPAHTPKQDSECIQCMNAPAFETRRRALKSAALNDNTIERQEPDGKEIVASMKRAVMTDNGVEWDETCYCTPPLRHERSSVYDQFFDHMKIEPVTSPLHLHGGRFWDYLRDHTSGSRSDGREVSTAYRARYVPIRIL